MTTTHETACLPPATSALLDLAALQQATPATDMLHLANRILTMTNLAPVFRAAVRDARQCADCGTPITEVGAPELLVVADAATALVNAHTALLDALLDANDFLRGEGLAGIPL